MILKVTKHMVETISGLRESLSNNVFSMIPLLTPKNELKQNWLYVSEMSICDFGS